MFKTTEPEQGLFRTGRRMTTLGKLRGLKDWVNQQISSELAKKMNSSPIMPKKDTGRKQDDLVLKKLKVS